MPAFVEAVSEIVRTRTASSQAPLWQSEMPFNFRDVDVK
jgi:hypothetical protein